MNLFYKILLYIVLITTANIANSQGWRELLDSANRYQQINEINTATSFGLRALDIAKSQLNALDTNIADIAALLTYLSWSSQNFDKALEYARLDSSIRVQAIGKQSPGYVNTLMNLGDQYVGLKNFDMAEANFIAAVETAKKIYNPNHINLSLPLKILAEYYQSRGENAKADSINNEGYAIFMRSQSWSGMMDSSYAYKMKNNMYKAIEWAKIALDTAIENMGILDTSVAIILSELTYDNWTLQRFEKALEYARMDSSVRAQTQGKESAGYIYSLLNIGAQYQGLGNLELAEAYNRECVEIVRKIYTGDHQVKAVVINNLAHILRFRGEFGKAEPYILEAIAINRRLSNGDNFELAQANMFTGEFYESKGDFSKAEEYYIESYEMTRRLFDGGDNPQFAELMGRIGRFYENRGDFVKAESFFIESLEMYRHCSTTDNNILARALYQLAQFYLKRGDYRQAEAVFSEALEMNKRIFKGDDPDLALNLNKAANFFWIKGDNQKAEEFFLESLEMNRRLFKGDNSGLANSINNIAAFYEAEKKYYKAEKYFVEGLEMSRRLYKSDNEGLAGSIHNMAFLYNSQGKYELAKPLYIEALEMVRRLFPTPHPNLISTLINVGFLYYNTGEYSEAEALFKEALDDSKIIFGNDNPKLANSYQTLANFYRFTGNSKLAENYYKESLNGFINVINNYFPELSESEKRNFWKTLSDVFESYYSFAVLRAEENPLVLGQIYDLQLYSKALLFNSYGKVRNRILNSNDSSLIEKFKELTGKKELLARLYTMTEESLQKNGYDIDSVEKETTELEKIISLKSEYFKQSYEKKKVTWRTIQAVLKPDEAAVEVVRFRDYKNLDFTDTVFYAFLIITNAMKDSPDLVIFSNGREMENDYYNEYSAKISDKVKDTLSYGRYWGKLFEKIKDYKKVYFSADGIYNKINPATLLKPNGRYILEEQDVQQVNSSRDIIIGHYRHMEDKFQTQDAILIGNPNFNLEEKKLKLISKDIKNNSKSDLFAALDDDTRGIALSPLPGTEKEIRRISTFLAENNWNVQTYLDDQAVKTVVKNVDNPRILHIATHGLFLEDVDKGGKEIFGFEKQRLIENPLLRSGLFFSGAQNFIGRDDRSAVDDENGILTAYEAMNLNLDYTELVVLSACETGLGEIQNGEGVYGLRRAFQQAGAHSVLMSLWKVNDLATQELMSNFYKNWVSGMTKREAFTSAQQEVRQKYPDPYYWGAFVMVGE